MKYEDIEKAKTLIKNHPNYEGHETSDAYYISLKKYIYFPTQKQGCHGVYHFRLQFNQTEYTGFAETMKQLKDFLDKDFTTGT